MRCRPVACAHCTLQRRKGSLITGPSWLRPQPAAPQELRNPASIFPEGAERETLVGRTHHLAQLVRAQIRRAHRITVGFEAPALDRDLIRRAFLEPYPFALEFLRKTVELSQLVRGDRLAPGELGVSRLGGCHRPALGPSGIDAVGRGEFAGLRG